MTTKTTAKTGPAYAAALAPVQTDLTAWRKRRKHREPIPQALWRRMATLAESYGVHPIAQALNVSYTALKRRLAANCSERASKAGVGSSGFVEVPLSGWPWPGQWAIELEDGRGWKLTLRLAPGDNVAALALAQGLWRGRI
jgi:hypothetical protein